MVTNKLTNEHDDYSIPPTRYAWARDNNIINILSVQGSSLCGHRDVWSVTHMQLGVSEVQYVTDSAHIDYLKVTNICGY